MYTRQTLIDGRAGLDRAPGVRPSSTERMIHCNNRANAVVRHEVHLARESSATLFRNWTHSQALGGGTEVGEIVHL